jgi:SOS-response transcriptional repressor LexA
MFALRVRGDSMTPTLPNGAIAVFQKVDGVPPVGRVVLASVSEDLVTGASLVVKRLAQEGDHLVLRSENTKYPPIPVPSEPDGAFRFEGVLKGMLEGR